MKIKIISLRGQVSTESPKFANDRPMYIPQIIKFYRELKRIDKSKLLRISLKNILILKILIFNEKLFLPNFSRVGRNIFSQK